MTTYRHSFTKLIISIIINADV